MIGSVRRRLSRWLGGRRLHLVGAVQHHLGEDHAVRDDDLHVVGVPQPGGADADVLHHAALGLHRDLVADPERPLKQQERPGHEALEDVLHRQRDPQAGNTHHRYERRQRHPDRVEDRGHAKADDRDVDDPPDQ